ncbi:hypothetical protein Cfla_3353 [Cellulomonas flavigena DSM 20109]|uniref:Uncharacterized protein n=1 Tax=Cellulomonas flavigena (strain ATCC 482 / DSM 20109 / BCRC 11376 / JCM 18109 / NBRC 3775 / NCIMB 8073 / NRS 134) TaxID=446466 RepID=D5UC73_CELFN|nr:hypothetical protein Cfla_3353 [Cellulomonas flavigena DSM 20109]
MGRRAACPLDPLRGRGLGDHQATPRGGDARAHGDPAPPADVLVERLGGIAPGGIVLLPDGGGDRSRTVEAVRRVIPRLRSDGWTFTVPR